MREDLSKLNILFHYFTKKWSCIYLLRGIENSTTLFYAQYYRLWQSLFVVRLDTLRWDICSLDLVLIFYRSTKHTLLFSSSLSLSEKIYEFKRAHNSFFLPLFHCPTEYTSSSEHTILLFFLSFTVREDIRAQAKKKQLTLWLRWSKRLT